MAKQFISVPWQWSATFEFGVNSKKFEISVTYDFFRSSGEISGWVSKYLVALFEMAAKLKISIEIIDSSLDRFDAPGIYHVNDMDPQKEAKSFFSRQLRNYMRFQNLYGGKLLE